MAGLTAVVLGALCLVVGVGVVVGLVMLVVAAQRRARERRDGLGQYAATREWGFLAVDPRLVDRFAGSPFGRGHARRATNAVHGTHGGRPFTAFDYAYSISGGSDGADSTHHHSVVAVALGVVAPGLSVARQGGLGRMVGRIFGTDLRLGDPAFDDAFAVSCEDPRFATDVLHPQMRQMLMAGGDLAWRFSRDSLLLVRSGSHSPAEIDARLAAADAILAQVPEPVWRALRAGTPDPGAPGGAAPASPPR